MKKIHMRQGPYNTLGLFFALTGFILVLLCSVGCLYPSGRGLYFTKVTDAVAPSNGSVVTAYYGWQGYCLQDQDLECFHDRSVMHVPFDVSISNQLNATYPRLFLDAITQDASLNPDSAPTPSHDPKIYPASVLCLLASATCILFCVLRITQPLRYSDKYYSRGFLAAGSAVLALLCTILSSAMYQNAITELNLEYPHLIATQGPAMTMIGVAFCSFFLGAVCLLRGAMSNSDDNETEGYAPL